MEQADAEGESLARAGAGLSDQIGAADRQRDRQTLDREGMDDASIS